MAKLSADEGKALLDAAKGASDLAAEIKGEIDDLADTAHKFQADLLKEALEVRAQDKQAELEGLATRFARSSFVASALQGLCAAGGGATPIETAKKAVELADLLVAELNK